MMRKKKSGRSRPQGSTPPSPARQRAAKSEKTQMATNRKFVPGDAKGVMADAEDALSLAGPTDAPGVDKIRELLFGNQMQDYDRRFTVMEDRFMQKMRDLEADSSRSLTSLEASMKKQLESMAAQFRNDKDVLAEADKALDRGLREQLQALEKRVGQAADQLGRVEREFMERLERLSQELREETKRRSEDTHKTIERMFSELSSVKTDRNLLAGLFVEIARCLNQDAMPKGGVKGAKADAR
jgi:archaellum component FlaC